MLLTESMVTIATTNAAIITSLNTVATWNEKEQEHLEDVIALGKSSISDFFLSEKIFLAAQNNYDASHKIITNLHANPVTAHARSLMNINRRLFCQLVLQAMSRRHLPR